MSIAAVVVVEVAQRAKELVAEVVRPGADLVEAVMLGQGAKPGQKTLGIGLGHGAVGEAHEDPVTEIAGQDGRTHRGDQVQNFPVLGVLLPQGIQMLRADTDVLVVQIQVRLQQLQMLRLNLHPAQEQPLNGGRIFGAGGVDDGAGDAAVQEGLVQVEIGEIQEGQLALGLVGQQDVHGPDGGGDDAAAPVDLDIGLGIIELVGMNAQHGFADGAVGRKGQGAGPNGLGIHPGREQVDMIGLQISVEMGISRVHHEIGAEIGDELQQVAAVDLSCGGDGSHLLGTAEILVYQLRQGDVEKVAQVDDQAQGKVPCAGEDQTQVPLGHIQTPLLQDRDKTVLAEIVAAHQRVELVSDGILVFPVQLLGQCRRVCLLHGHTPLTKFL